MEGIGFDPQLVYFVLKPKRAYGEGGGGEQLSVGKKTVREPLWGVIFFFGGGSFFFFFFQKHSVNN